MDNSLKDKVLEAVDIVAVIGERVPLTRKGREYVGLCPFHPDHNPSMSVSPQKRIFKCWSCGVGGDVIRFVQLNERVGFREALASLAKRAGIEQAVTPADRRADQLREQIQHAVLWARNHFRRNLEADAIGRSAREYALARGLSPETCERFALGLALEGWNDLYSAARRTGLSDEVLLAAGLIAKSESGKLYDRFRHRLIFPIADALGRPVAFGGRALGDDSAKYLNSPETVLFSKSRVLYGLDVARREIADKQAAIVVEGYMDAVLLHQHGFTNVVATLGTALTDAHVKLLRQWAEAIHLCFDGDDAGERAAQRAVEVALRTQADVRVVLLEAGKDPADCVVEGGNSAFEERLKGAVDALEFKWSQTVRTFREGGRRARQEAIEQFLRFVADVTVTGGVDPLQQSMLTGRLSDLLGVPPDTVFELLSNAKRTVRRSPATRGSTAEEMSDYEASIRGLPTSLVTALETVLGHLLVCPACWGRVDDTLARAADHSETWQRLYRVLLEVHDEVGEYSLGDVVARCADGALCELVDRARARTSGVASHEEDFHAAHTRVACEMDVLHCGELREDLRQPGSDDEDVYRRLCERSHGQSLPLAPERSGNAPYVAPQHGA